MRNDAFESGSDSGSIGYELRVDAGGGDSDYAWVWLERVLVGEQEVEIRFVGRGPAGDRHKVLRRIEGEDAAPPVAWLKQIHSDRALPASAQADAGPCGEGDGIYTEQRGLALCVVTADCVPVLVAAPGGGVAAIHAGWRGLVNGVIASTLAALERQTGTPVRGRGSRAWIGPSIGPCCYEVGDEVAREVVAASGPEVVRRGPAGKPHLDLALAAGMQLEREGIGTLTSFGPMEPCTRCAEDRLWSYRREGKGAGRNLAFIWRR